MKEQRNEEDLLILWKFNTATVAKRSQYGLLLPNFSRDTCVYYKYIFHVM